MSPNDDPLGQRSEAGATLPSAFAGPLKPFSPAHKISGIIPFQEDCNPGNGPLRYCLILKIVCLAFVACVTFAGAGPQRADGQALVIWIAVDGRTPLKKAAPGTTLEGKLTRPVYWRDTEVFSTGNPVRLVVDKIESRKKTDAVDDRPFVIHLFAPRHDAVVRFRSVNVLMPGGAEVPLRAQFIAFAQRAELTAQPTKPTRKWRNKPALQTGPSPKSKPQKIIPPLVLTLRVEPEGTSFSALASTHAGGDAAAIGSESLHHCRRDADVPGSAQGRQRSQEPPGQSLQAMLVEPMGGPHDCNPPGKCSRRDVGKACSAAPLVSSRLLIPSIQSLGYSKWLGRLDCRFSRGCGGRPENPHDDGFGGKNPRPKPGKGQVFVGLWRDRRDL